MTSSAAPPRVVVIDDDAVQLRAVDLALSGAGYTVEVLTSPIGATNNIARTQTALVIIDLHMPAMSGRDIARIIRQHPRISDVPILFRSSAEAKELAEAVTEVGAQGFVSKMTGVEGLLREVEGVLGRPPASAGVAGAGVRDASSVATLADERRSKQRRAFVAAWYASRPEHDEDIAMYVSNVSESGLGLYVNVPLQRGETLQVRAGDEADTEPVSAVVRWTRRVHNLYAVGAEFSTADPDEHRRVSLLVGSLGLAS